MSIGEILKNRRLELDLTLEEVGNYVGVTKSTVKKWESDYIANMGRDKIGLLAKTLKMSPLVILGLEDIQPYRIPVYGTIPAGIPLEAIQDIQDYEEIPVEWLRNGKEYVALTVKGDSMYPKYLEGDIVIIQVQPDCESGQNCAVYINGYNVTLKTVIKQGDKIKLQPINPNYAPETYNAEFVKILGVVKETRRKE